MESAVVNARIPVAKRDAAKGILSSLGKTTTDLINSAYDYLLAEGKLPDAKDAACDRSQKLADFQNFLNEATCPVDWGVDDGRDYKDLLAEALEGKYGPLA